MSSKEPDQISEEEAARRRDEALKRMLKTPPKPHKDEPKRRPTQRNRAKK